MKSPNLTPIEFAPDNIALAVSGIGMITSEVIDKSTLMEFAAQNLGIGLAPQWIENISPGGLAFIPFMPGDVSIDMYIAYRKNGNSPTTNEFISAAKEVALQVAELR